MAEITAADAFIKTLLSHGVNHVFGLPGTSVAPFLDGLIGYPEINYLLALHESVCVGMADGYARVSGKPALVNVHNMPGAANCVGLIFTAHRDHVPMVVTAGQQETRALGLDGHASARNMPNVVSEFTRWSWETRSSARVAHDLARGLNIAISHPRGPVFLSLPKDQLWERYERELPRAPGDLAMPRIAGDPHQLARAAALLAEAKNPLIVAGSEVVPAGGVSELVALAELLGAPVVLEPGNAYLAFPTDHPLYFGAYRADDPLVTAADVVFGVGCRLLAHYEAEEPSPWSAQTKIVHLSVDPTEINRTIAVDVGIIADARSGVAGLLAACREQAPAQMEELRAARRRRLETAQIAYREGIRRRLEAEPDHRPMRPWRLIKEMSETLDERTIIVNEGVGAGFTLRDLYPFPDPSCCLSQSCGVLGWGSGAALGAKVAAPDRPVVLFTGDGAFYFSVQALWTAARYNIPVVHVVINNRGYNAVRTALRFANGRAVAKGVTLGADITDPEIDVVKLSEAFGVPAVRVEQPEEVGPALKRALASGRPAVIDVASEAPIRPRR